MTNQQFLQHFGHLIDAPNGIQKLRELILQLAVQGKLVDQDPNEEPASNLLEKISDKKSELIKGKIIRKGKKLPGPEEDKIPFLLPGSWSWCRLGDVTNYGATGKAEARDVTDDTWILELEDVEKVTSRLLKRTTFRERQFKSSKNRFVESDVIYGKLRPYLDKVLVADQDGVCTTEMIPMRGYYGIVPEYLRWYLKSPYFIQYADSSTHGMNLPRMGTDKGRMALFPFPPLVEQHRIVAKVDELMALCDQLEAVCNARVETHQRLIRAVHHPLTEASDTATTQAAWHRIRDNFADLYTTLESAQVLRQTILQLGVQGKLVLQDPSDEPASGIINKVAAERSRLAKEKAIKKPQALEPIRSTEQYFPLPRGWAWCQASDVSDPKAVITYGILKPIWVSSGVPTVRVRDMKDGAIALNEVVECSIERAKKFTKTTLREGDLLIAKDGATLGKTAFVPKELDGGNITQHVLRFAISDEVSRSFIRLIVDSPYGQWWMTGETKGVALPGVNVGDFRRMPMPVPPLAEQRRIVFKVDELMALCDQLETNIRDKNDTAARYAEAIVQQIAAA